MADAYDLRRNVEATTHFLEVVNASSESGASQDLPGDVPSDAVIRLLRSLREAGPAPLDEAMRRSALDLLDFSEALARMRRAQLVELTTSAESECELLTLTDDGERLAQVIDSSGPAV